MKTNNILAFTAFLAFIVGLLFSSCNSKEDVQKQYSPTITQGIYGQVLERYGDWMPVYDPNDGQRGYRPLVREVYIYEYTKLQDFEYAYRGCYYPADSMPQPLVIKTTSNKDGYYQVQLEPGTYSFFVLEEGSMYANGGDAYGGIMPVTIFKDSILQVNLVIDHGVD